MHDVFVAYLHQAHTDEDPEQFANAGVEAGKDTDARSTQAEQLHDKREATLTRTKLHGQEEKDVSHKR